MCHNPTIASIRAAIKKSDAMHGVYDCTPLAGLPGRFYVQHKEQSERCYLVDTREGSARCSCPAFENDSVCKHLAHAMECEQIAEGEEKAQARIDYAFPEPQYAF